MAENEFFNSVEEEILITEEQRHSLLYDAKHKDYKINVRGEAAWRLIAEKTDRPMITWFHLKSIRDIVTFELNTRPFSPGAVRVPDGSETETETESGGEEINYFELKPSAFDLEKVPHLGDYLNAVELRGDLAALKRQKEIMAAMQEIINKLTKTIFSDHMVPLEEYPGYCDLRTECKAIQSRLTLDTPGENVPDDYFENEHHG
ncbi:unnamed protein product [Bemisia tabaci]|uniref:MADF domain-containing protein n=1 Tax=Bemisia tabaci TaxID=7038 RepID=A0A9P0F3Q8_BEMTA|nr:unnamed protein product [Bemisia tabaci]